MTIRRRGRDKGTIVFIAAVCFFLSGALSADDFFKVKENIEKNSWRKIGFIYVSPSIVLKDVGYTSNIFFYDEGATPDWTADAGFQADLSVLIGKRLILTVRESPYYSFYLENKDLQYFNNDLSATLYTYIGRFNLKYVFRQGDFLSRPTVEFGNRIRTVTDRHSISIDYGNYNRFFISTGADIEELNYNDAGYFEDYNVSGRMNRKRRALNLALNRVIFTRTLLTFSYEYYDLEFADQKERDGSGGVFSLGIRFPEVGILTGQFRMGVKYFRPEDPLAVEYRKPNGSGQVSFRLTKRFRLRMSYDIDNYYSYFVPDQYFDLRRYSAGLDYYVTRNIKAGYTFSSSESVYRFISGDDPGRKDIIEQSDLRLGFRVSGNMELGVQYTQYNGRSSFLEFTRAFHSIGGYINHEF